ncbi:hypothetical protein EKH79_13980 [Dyella dinghuensis]|uniref:DUF1080 domain-containing protein n=1 Tax=Dyella dinghuensis TaxID=1920169 RepID=A0A3S0PCS1_9GAMM|nr:hypothetical protein [Dyella dinghuensis]RUL62021.1 hypothetical protein EKH79_13980 [Dyella dinghuensis]
MSALSKYASRATGFYWQRNSLFFAAIVGLSQPILAFEQTDIPMTPAKWLAKGDVSFQHDQAKQPILVVNKGYAELKNTDFSNGTIEFDTKFVGERITGITFRQHDDAADALYFRPSADCAVSEECIQYMPTAHHLFEWDLYGQYQTRAPINTDGWNHIKLVLSGARMNVFVNGAHVPTLAVGTLVGGFPDGSIRLHGPASYAHLSIAPNVVDGLPAMASSDAAKDDPRYVRHWLASKPFVMPSRMDATLQENTGIDPIYSSLPKQTASWKPVALDPGGLVNLTRWYGDAQIGQAITGIWLKTTINADRDQIKHVEIGWTREVWVFVNGKLAFQSKNLYGIKGASKEPGGRLSLTNGSFDLPLQKGANQVVVAIDDNFAGGQQHWGWGVEMRLADTDGIRQSGGAVAKANAPNAF